MKTYCKSEEAKEHLKETFSKVDVHMVDLKNINNNIISNRWKQYQWRRLINTDF